MDTVDMQQHTQHHSGHSSAQSADTDHAEHSSDHKAHVDHIGHEIMFRNRFWVCLVLTVPVLLYSPALQAWLNFSMPAFPGSRWIAPVFAIIIFLYGGVPFLQMAVPEIKNRQPGMMTLISLAISVAFVYSVATLFIPLGESFFWELVTLIDVMLLLVVVAISTSLSARNGILVRDRLALESARNLDTIIFDKTGTLTKGEQGVVSMAMTDGYQEEEALALTAAIEADSEHMIAKGIRQAAKEKGL